jgi:hypothetical protein
MRACLPRSTLATTLRCRARRGKSQTSASACMRVCVRGEGGRGGGGRAWAGEGLVLTRNSAASHRGCSPLAAAAGPRGRRPAAPGRSRTCLCRLPAAAACARPRGPQEHRRRRADRRQRGLRAGLRGRGHPRAAVRLGGDVSVEQAARRVRARGRACVHARAACVHAGMAVFIVAVRACRGRGASSRDACLCRAANARTGSRTRSSKWCTTGARWRWRSWRSQLSRPQPNTHGACSSSVVLLLPAAAAAAAAAAAGCRALQQLQRGAQWRRTQQHGGCSCSRFRPCVCLVPVCARACPVSTAAARVLAVSASRHPLFQC